MKTYKVLVTIREGNDEFWEEVARHPDQGCSEVVEMVRDGLAMMGWDELVMEDEVSVELVSFTNE